MEKLFKSKRKCPIQADILMGSFGKTVNEEIQKKYGYLYIIKSIIYNPETELIEGSNIPYVIAVNEFIRPKGLRTPTVDDFKLINQFNLLDLSGHIVDIACVVRLSKWDNEYLAKRLMEGKTKQKFPITINLSDLELIKDDMSEDGLAFKLREDAQLIPKDLGKYKSYQAMSRLCSSGDSDSYLSSNNGNLIASYFSSRVVVVSNYRQKV